VKVTRKEYRYSRMPRQFYQLKTAHYLTKNKPTAKCRWSCYKIQTREHLFKNCPQWKHGRRSCGLRCGERRGEARIVSRSEIFSLSGAARRSWTSSPPVPWDGGYRTRLRKTLRARRRRWDIREREERGEERRLEAEGLDASEERLRFFPTPSLASRKRIKDAAFSCLFFVISSVRPLCTYVMYTGRTAHL